MAPGQVDGFATVDTGLAKLAELAVDVVRPVSVRVAIGQCAAIGDARPVGTVLVRKQMEVAVGPGGGLEVVGAVEPRLDQPPPQPPPAGQIPPLGALVDPDGVEPGRPRQPVRERGGGQQGDMGAGMVAADRGERAERQDDVAEGAKLHHQDAAGVRHHAGG